jgi:hypothetical protein
MIFWRKTVIFHTKYPQNVRASLRNWKKYDFLAYNRDFSHEIPKKNFAPPSAQRNFLSEPPLTINPGSAPDYLPYSTMLLYIHSIVGRYLGNSP